MAVIVGTNSYITVAEADAYFAERYGYDKWDLEPDKEGALISATQNLDMMCTWLGTKCDDSQALAFPRTPDCPEVPQDIMDAQCEVAYNIVNQGSVSQDAGDPLTELKAGSVTLKFEASSPNNPLRSGLVDNLISGYGLCGGGSTRIIPMERQ